MTTAIVLALVSSICIALGLVLSQFGLRHTEPRRGALVSVPTSTVLLWLLSPFALDWHAIEPRAVTIFAGVGLLFPAAVTLLTFEANRRMGPNVAGALGNLTPLFALLFAAALLAELPSAVQGVGIAAVIVGVAGLSLRRQGGDRPWSLWAAAIPLAAALIRGVVQPITKLGLAVWPSPFAAVLIGYTVSSIVLLAAAVLRRSAAPPPPAAVAWFAAVGVANVTANLFLYAALGVGPVTLVSPLVSTYPLVTLALSALVLRSTRLDAPLVGSVILTVGGIAILIAGR
jgi:drug/metabolite transporter (DMT)-like permease